MFNLNVGGADRTFRIVLGLVLLVLAFFVVGGFWAAVAGLFGAIFLITGIIGWCPLYLPFKFSTRKS
jgi:O-antigen/teichoic acid export membrane protein